MEKKEFIYNNIPVTILKTNKFKTVVGTLYFKEPIKEKMITTRRLLRNLIMHSCKKFPTSKDLNINVLENYNSDYSAATIREGNYIINSFSFRILEDKYTKKGNFLNGLDTFKEIIFNPNIDNDEFNKEEFSLLYQTLKSEIESMIENPRNYAIDNLMKQLGKGTVVSYAPNLKELKKINSKSICKEYLDMMKNSEKEFVLAGNITDEILDGCKKILDNLNQKSYNIPLIVTNDCIDNEIKNKIKKYDGKQSILTLGLKLADLTIFERLYVLPVYNGILGGGASSRLFNTIREKNSLAYFCFSRYEKDDSLIIIVSGIEESNYRKTYNLMKKVLESMKKISDDEIKRVKEEIISSLKESKDYLQSYPNNLYFNKLYDIDSNEEIIKNIKLVNKEDIEKIYYKLFLTNSYFLKGVKTDGKNKN